MAAVTGRQGRREGEGKVTRCQLLRGRGIGGETAVKSSRMVEGCGEAGEGIIEVK